MGVVLMSKPQTKRWFIELVREPSRARWELGYQNPLYGRRLWMSGPWMCPIDPLTSAQVLDEFWWAVLEARGENYKK